MTIQNVSSLQANPPVEVSDLIDELKDGQILLTLVEVLLGIKVSRETKKNRISYIKNVQEAMRILARSKVLTCLDRKITRFSPPGACCCLFQTIRYKRSVMMGASKLKVNQSLKNWLKI